MKPYAESCDQNADPIFAVIAPLLQKHHSLLEIGSGTGQHAVNFAARLPHLTWQTSDLPENHAGIRLWLEEANLPNILPPIALDTRSESWPGIAADSVFSANTAHIMHWQDVQGMFRGIGRLLPPGGLFLLYGPFNYQGQYTSASNERFDQWLQQRDPLSGIRNFEDLDKLATKAGMQLQNDYAMPANNRILCWKRLPTTSSSG